MQMVELSYTTICSYLGWENIKLKKTYFLAWADTDTLAPDQTLASNQINTKIVIMNQECTVLEQTIKVMF